MAIDTGEVRLLEALSDFSFTEFITLKLIKVLYVLGMIVIAIGVLVTVIGAFSEGLLNGLGAIILAGIGGFLSVLILRVYLEVVAVLFRIASNTTEVAENTRP